MDCFAAHGRRALRDVCETCPGFRCAPPGLNTDSNFKQQRDLRHGFAISPRVSREVWPARSALLLIGGRRECRAPDAPDSRVCNVIGRTHTRWSGHTGITRHSPRNGFNGLLRTLPGDRAFLSPSSSGYGVSKPGRADMPPPDLTPASRRQDHTTSPSEIKRRSSARRLIAHRPKPALL